VTLRSGQAFTPTISSDTANTGLAGQLPTCCARACAGLDPNGTDTFALPPAQVRYGTGGRNTGCAPTA
jgi:hypothetical protein